MAGALAASKLHIPVAHVEAGLRSFNRKMPEEINRVLTDHISDLLFAPTHTGIKNLKTEGIVSGVYHTGDVMYDAALLFGKISDSKSKILEELQIKTRQYYLTTIHRAENKVRANIRLINAICRIPSESKQALNRPPNNIAGILYIGSLPMNSPSKRSLGLMGEESTTSSSSVCIS